MEPGQDGITLFLCGDVMLGRGIDQIMHCPSDPTLYESYVTSALGYVELAERAHGPIPRDCPFDYVWGDSLNDLDAAHPAARIVNVETSITTSMSPVPKGINYKMHPGNDSLPQGGWRGLRESLCLCLPWRGARDVAPCSA